MAAVPLIFHQNRILSPSGWNPAFVSPQASGRGWSLRSRLACESKLQALVGMDARGGMLPLMAWPRTAAIAQQGMAEAVRFELTEGVALGSFQDCCLKPLGHTSDDTASWQEVRGCDLCLRLPCPVHCGDHRAGPQSIPEKCARYQSGCPHPGPAGVAIASVSGTRRPADSGVSRE